MFIYQKLAQTARGSEQKSMIQVETYQDTITRIQDTLCEVLDLHRDFHPINPLLQIGDYALAARGKMLRGILLLKACQAVGGTPEQILYAAAGTEYGHLASLVHDDMMDQDEVRRGQPTIWKAYGSDLALLTGDLFIFEAYHSLSLCRHAIPAERVARTFEVLSRACIDLCLGQAREAQLTGNCSASVSDYIEMIRQKTGSLFRAALESGAILGGGSEEQIVALRTFGDQLGIAFQIIDDLLPYLVQATTLRKPTESDIKNRRITLPILYAFEQGLSDDHCTLRRIFADGWLADEPTKAKHLVLDILHRTGAIERAQQEALCYQQRALAQLDCLLPNAGTDFLHQAAELAIHREQ